MLAEWILFLCELLQLSPGPPRIIKKKVWNHQSVVTSNSAPLLNSSSVSMEQAQELLQMFQSNILLLLQGNKKINNNIVTINELFACKTLLDSFERNCSINNRDIKVSKLIRQYRELKQHYHRDLSKWSTLVTDHNVVSILKHVQVLEQSTITATITTPSSSSSPSSKSLPVSSSSSSSSKSSSSSSKSSSVSSSSVSSSSTVRQPSQALEQEKKSGTRKRANKEFKDADHVIALERAHALEEVSQDINELNSLVHEMNHIIREDHKQLQWLEDNVTDAQQEVTIAKQNLQTAEKYQEKTSISSLSHSLVQWLIGDSHGTDNKNTMPNNSNNNNKWWWL
jgi:prefoldin subunit 5